MSEDDDPKTLGEYLNIFERNGLKVANDSTFHNARKVLELENKAKGEIKSFTDDELKSELQRRFEEKERELQARHDAEMVEAESDAERQAEAEASEQYEQDRARDEAEAQAEADAAAAEAAARAQYEGCEE